MECSRCSAFSDERAYLAQVSLLLHVDAALVDGDRHDGQPFRAAVALELHDVLEVVEIEVRNETIALKERDELARRQKAEFFAAPAHERFGADAALRDEVVFRLVPDFKFLAPERGLLQAFHTARQMRFGKHLVVVDEDVLRLVHGEIGARHHLRGFEHLHAIRRFASDGRDACRQRHAYEHAADRRELIALERDVQLRFQRGEVFRLGEEDDFADAAMRRDAAHPVGFGEDIGELLQERNERVAPIRADEDVRALDADDDDGKLRRFLWQRSDERIGLAQEPAAVRPFRRAILVEQRLHFADVRAA